MTEQYRPNHTYWRKVATLDRKLVERGRQLDQHETQLLNHPGFDVREVDWRDNEKDYQFLRFNSPRVFPFGRLNMGSSLYEAEELPLGGVRSLYPGQSTGLVRHVYYVSSGVYGWGSHGVKDRVHTIEGFDAYATGAKEIDFPRLRAQALKESEQQQASGYSLPTKETFDFIVDTLKQAEVATR